MKARISGLKGIDCQGAIRLMRKCANFLSHDVDNLPDLTSK